MAADKYINGLFTSGGNVVATETVAEIGEVTGTIRANGGLYVRDSSGNYIQLMDGTSLTKVVQSASDLSGTLDSTILYIIDGIIDMGSTKIEVPATGLSIVGLSVNVSKLISTATSYTMFTSPVGGSGNLFIENCTLDVSGASSSVYGIDDVSGFNAFECDRINFENCTSLGFIDGYRQALWTNWGLFDCDDGIELRSSWVGGFRATTGIVRTLSSGGTVFKAGTGLVFNGRFLTDMNAVIASGAIGIDFIAANFATESLFQVQGTDFSGAGDFIPNIAASSIKSLWRDNKGVDNTYQGGTWSCTSATATTISSSSVFVKLAGTTTYTDLQHFSNTTNNAFVFDGTITTDFKVDGSVAISGSNNNVITIRVRHWDDSASAYVNIGDFESKISSGAAGTRTENIGFIALVKMDKDDRIELWIANETASNDVTLVSGGRALIDER